MLLSALTQLALSQTFAIHDSTMLEPVAGSWYEAGLGSPSVVYRKQQDDYVMFFESMLAPPDATCKQGSWGVGVAVSPNGRDWTVASAPLMTPQTGTFRSCVVAHPYAVIDDNGSDIHLWYKAEQPRKACKGLPSPHAWGCKQYTGVGYAKVGADLQTLLQDEAMPVVATVETFGYPAVTKVDDTWYMVLARKPDFYLATSTDPDTGWVVDPTPVLSPGVTSWSNDELYNPALVCDENDASYPFRMYFAGRNKVGNTIIDGGWGDAVSGDANSWLVNALPYFSFVVSPDLAWRHIDAMKVGPDTVIYFSEKDSAGVNHIGRAGTSETWADWRVESRQCPQPDGWFEVTPGTDLVDALDELRDLFLEELPSGDADVDDGIDDALDAIDDSFLEVAVGRPDNLGTNLWQMIDKLQRLSDDTGHDTSFLEQAAASVALHAMRQLVDRVESVEGPTSSGVLGGQAALDDVEQAYVDGDWLEVAWQVKSGSVDLKNPTYAGNFCPAAPLDSLHVVLCDVQQVHADIADLYAANPSENKLSRALAKTEDALEAIAEHDVELAVRRMAEASDNLDQASPVDVTTAQEGLAWQGGILARDFLDDAAVWGDASAAEIDTAELLWLDGEDAYDNGLFQDASDAYEDAVDELAP